MTASYCVSCDRKTCEHDGLRYLDPIVYEQIWYEKTIDHPDGTSTTKQVFAGWAPPDDEIERWESDRWTGTSTTPVTAPDPKTLAEVLSDLGRIAYLDDHIRLLIQDAYETNPLQTWQLSESIQRRRSHLENPSGVLVKGLRAIVSHADIPRSTDEST